jgi:RNA polymerase sigma-70 factor (ECF subfamily)
MVRFPTTSWSIVIAAGGNPSTEARDALAALCQAYWRPLHEYVLYQGYGTEDAQDLTQEFFTRLIEKNYSAQADRRRGRFRSFLLGAARHFLASEARYSRAQKRGGGEPPLSLEFETPEGDLRVEPRNDLTPDKIFERRWALTVIDRALEGLRDVKHFERLNFCLTGGGAGVSYSVLAAELGLTEGALKQQVRRLRRRFGELVRAEIALTVESEDQIDEELRYLLAVIGG